MNEHACRQTSAEEMTQLAVTLAFCSASMAARQGPYPANLQRKSRTQLRPEPESQPILPAAAAAAAALTQ